MTVLDNFKPSEIIVYNPVRDNDITQKILEKYPAANVSFVDTQKPSEIIPTKGRAQGDVVDKSKSILMLGTNNSFVKEFEERDEPYCAGLTKLTPVSNGCYFSCEYCYMQQTYRKIFPFIKFAVNYEDMVKEIEKKVKKGPRVYDMGELQDSLAFDEIYPLTKILVPFFAETDSKLLLLTKSDCIDNLVELRDKHKGKTIVSWSINSDFVVNNVEHNSASLDGRISSAVAVQNAGYEVRFRFDPLIMTENWKQEYTDMVEKILNKTQPSRITLGSFRLETGLFKAISERFPDSLLLDETKLESKNGKPVKSGDGKYRYRDDIRIELYEHVINEIKKRTDADIALCKESSDVWEAVDLELEKGNCKCHCRF